MPKPDSVTPSQTLTHEDDFHRIGGALTLDDVNAAKQAFATWQQDMLHMRAQQQYPHERQGLDKAGEAMKIVW